MGIPRLLSKIDLGNSSCRFDASEGDCELAREVVKIAAGWTSTSTSRKLSKTTLRSLLGKSPDRIDEDFPEHLDSVLEWLSLPVSPGCFIIEPTKHGVTGNIEFNASLGAVVSEMAGGPELSVWNAEIADAVRSGEGDVLGRVGYEAYCTGNQPAADLAWRHITEYDDPAVQWMHRAAGFSFKKLLEPGFHAELQRAENTKSIPLLERLVELLSQRRPPDPIGMAEAEMRLAFAYRGATENDKALQSFEHAAELIQQELGPNDVKLAKVLDDIAVTSVGTEKSRRAQERALEIRKVSGDPKIVFSLFNLASSCMTSDPARARNYLVEALEISSSPNSRRPDFLIPVIISQLQLLGVRVFRGPDGRPMPELETSGPSDLAN